MYRSMLIAFFAVYCLHAADLQITIHGVQWKRGPLHVCLFSDMQGFLNPDRAVKRVSIDSTGRSDGSVSGVFRDLSLGQTYALFAFQDSNGNGVFDCSLRNIPREPYGFSETSKKGIRTYLETCFVLKGRDSLSLQIRSVKSTPDSLSD
ncbi:MAG: DUF2141 domain-containing protein [Fibrobacterota bacterium]